MGKDLDSIVVSVFVNIGWVGQILYQNRDPHNHSRMSRMIKIDSLDIYQIPLQ